MQLAYRKYGKGQPLLILHGLFGQSDNWNTLAKRFGDNGFEVYTIDLRNHGLSPHSEVWNYEVMADDIKEFIDTHNLQNPILMGHSMGGKTAMFFALKYDGILSKLIVVDMSPCAYEPQHDLILEGLNAVDFSKINTRKEAEAVLSAYIADMGTKQFLLKNLYREDSTNSKMNWRFNLPVITKNIRELIVPVPSLTSDVNTLFLRGEKSNYIKEEVDTLDPSLSKGEQQDTIITRTKTNPEIEQRFPNYKLQTIANAAHWIHAEQPDAFYEAVMGFIK